MKEEARENVGAAFTFFWILRSFDALPLGFVSCFFFSSISLRLRYFVPSVLNFPLF